jgi:magnesium transporter
MNALSEQLRLHEPITAHMRRGFASVRPYDTLEEAVARLRRDPPEGPIVYFYVVDDDDRLLGVVPTRRLLLESAAQRVADIMIRKLVTLPVEATVEDACEFFIQYRLLALPVVDATGKLLGVVDVQLYTEEIDEIHQSEQREDLFQRVGVLAGGSTESPWAAFRRRLPWLSCNVIGGLLAALLGGLFENPLGQAMIVLGLFVPVVLNLAESVSSQSVSLTLHLLGGSRPTWQSFLRQFRVEVVVGLLLGVACGLVVALMALLWRRDWRVAGALLGGIGAGVAASALLGMTLPVVLRLLHLDPRVAAGPIALASADIVTIVFYYSLALLLLG